MLESAREQTVLLQQTHQQVTLGDTTADGESHYHIIDPSFRMPTIRERLVLDKSCEVSLLKLWFERFEILKSILQCNGHLNKFQFVKCYAQK